MLYIAFVLGPQKWSIELFYAVGILNYTHKVCAAIALIPSLYIARGLIRSYLGEGQARHLREQAARD